MDGKLPRYLARALVHRRSFGGFSTRASRRSGRARHRRSGASPPACVHYTYGLVGALIHGAVRDYSEDVLFRVTVPATIYLINDMGAGGDKPRPSWPRPRDLQRTRVILSVWRNHSTWLPGPTHWDGALPAGARRRSAHCRAQSHAHAHRRSRHGRRWCSAGAGSPDAPRTGRHRPRIASSGPQSQPAPHEPDPRAAAAHPQPESRA